MFAGVIRKCILLSSENLSILLYLINGDYARVCCFYLVALPISGETAELYNALDIETLWEDKFVLFDLNRK